MKIRYFIVLLVLLLLFSCGKNKYRYGFFDGNWVEQSYLDTVVKYRSVYKASALPFTELCFKRYVDSVYFINLSGNVSAYAIENVAANRVHILAKEQPNNLFFNRFSYEMFLGDSDSGDKFVAVDNLLVDSFSNIGIPSSRIFTIHSIVLGGVYKQPDNAIPIQFFVKGKISGWDLYSGYEVCLTDADRKNFLGDVVMLTNTKTTDAYTWEWKDNSLKLTALDIVDNTYKKSSRTFTFTKLK